MLIVEQPGAVPGRLVEVSMEYAILPQYADMAADGIEPDPEDMADWLNDGGAECPDGCWVEPDGTCEHGQPSWLIVYGIL